MAKLKRDLNLLEVVLSGIGIILGAGIYVLIGSAAGIAGNAVWVSFLFGAAIAAFTGLSYAELSSLFPKADAEHEYSKEAFEKGVHKGIGSFIAFITGWMVIASGIFAGATVAAGFSKYFVALFSAPMFFVIIALMIAISYILFKGVKDSAIAASLMTLIEGGGLIIIIIVAIPFFGSVDYFYSPNGIQGILSAGALIFFAYLGFEEIVRLSEETRNPQKTIPKALIISIVVSTILYVLVALAAVSLMPWDQLAGSHAPMAEAVSRVLGNTGFIMLSVIALFSTFNTVLMVLLATSRVSFGMGRDKSLPKQLAIVHKKRKTPWVSIAAIAIISLIFAISFNMDIIAGVTDFLVFVTFAIINLAAIVLRYKMPKKKRVFKIPLNAGKMPVFPLLGLITSILLMYNVHPESALYGLLVILAGLLFYGFYHSFGKKTR